MAAKQQLHTNGIAASIVDERHTLCACQGVCSKLPQACDQLYVSIAACVAVIHDAACSTVQCCMCSLTHSTVSPTLDISILVPLYTVFTALTRALDTPRMRLLVFARCWREA